MRKSIRNYGAALAILAAGAVAGATLPTMFDSPAQAAAAAEGKGEGKGAGKAAAEEPKKMVAEPMWVVFAIDDPEARKTVSKECWDAHLKHGVWEEQQGIRVLGGALSKEDGTREYGMFVIRAKDAADARRIAEADPAVQCKERTVTLHKWDWNSGRMNFSVNFSDSSASFE